MGNGKTARMDSEFSPFMQSNGTIAIVKIWASIDLKAIFPDCNGVSEIEINRSRKLFRFYFFSES